MNVRVYMVSFYSTVSFQKTVGGSVVGWLVVTPLERIWKEAAMA